MIVTIMLNNKQPQKLSDLQNTLFISSFINLWFGYRFANLGLAHQAQLSLIGPQALNWVQVCPPIFITLEAEADTQSNILLMMNSKNLRVQLKCICTFNAIAHLMIANISLA